MADEKDERIAKLEALLTRWYYSKYQGPNLQAALNRDTSIALGAIPDSALSPRPAPEGVLDPRIAEAARLLRGAAPQGIPDPPEVQAEYRSAAPPSPPSPEDRGAEGTTNTNPISTKLVDGEDRGAEEEARDFLNANAGCCADWVMAKKLTALLLRREREAMGRAAIQFDAALAQLSDASRVGRDTRLAPVAAHCRQLMEVHPESKMLLWGMAINIDHSIESAKWLEEKIAALRGARAIEAERGGR